MKIVRRVSPPVHLLSTLLTLGEEVYSLLFNAAAATPHVLAVETAAKQRNNAWATVLSQRGVRAARSAHHDQRRWTRLLRALVGD